MLSYPAGPFSPPVEQLREWALGSCTCLQSSALVLAIEGRFLLTLSETGDALVLTLSETGLTLAETCSQSGAAGAHYPFCGAGTVTPLLAPSTR